MLLDLVKFSYPLQGSAYDRFVRTVHIFKDLYFLAIHRMPWLTETSLEKALTSFLNCRSMADHS